MSIGIGAVRPSTVVHVTDTRLTSLVDRSVLSEALRKSLIVRGTEAQFVLSWCGLASADGGHRTADWLLRVLCEMDAVSLGPEQIVGNLADLATAHFQSLSAHDKRCEFLLGGWHNSEPFVGVVSNYAHVNVRMPSKSGMRHHLPSFSEAPVAAAQFQGWTQHFRSQTEHHYVVSLIGDCDGRTLKTQLRGLKGLMKKQASAQRIVCACTQIAREASGHSKTIGKDLIAVEMERSGSAFCSYYSEEGTETMLLPDTLSVKGVTTQITVTASITGDRLKMRFQGKIAKRPAPDSV
jgi:hypothetical protein